MTAPVLDVVGWRLDDALARLADAGLRASVVRTGPPGGVREGPWRVVRVRPAAGPEGEQVELTVAAEAVAAEDVLSEVGRCADGSRHSPSSPQTPPAGATPPPSGPSGSPS